MADEERKAVCSHHAWINTHTPAGNPQGGGSIQHCFQALQMCPKLLQQMMQWYKKMG